jgi:hypothetical protein
MLSVSPARTLARFPLARGTDAAAAKSELLRHARAYVERMTEPSIADTAGSVAIGIC